MFGLKFSKGLEVLEIEKDTCRWNHSFILDLDPTESLSQPNSFETGRFLMPNRVHRASTNCRALPIWNFQSL